MNLRDHSSFEDGPAPKRPRISPEIRNRRDRQVPDFQAQSEFKPSPRSANQRAKPGGSFTAKPRNSLHETYSEASKHLRKGASILHRASKAFAEPDETHSGLPVSTQTSPNTSKSKDRQSMAVDIPISQSPYRPQHVPVSSPQLNLPKTHLRQRGNRAETLGANDDDDVLEVSKEHFQESDRPRNVSPQSKDSIMNKDRGDCRVRQTLPHVIKTALNKDIAVSDAFSPAPMVSNLQEFHNVEGMMGRPKFSGSTANRLRFRRGGDEGIVNPGQQNSHLAAVASKKASPVRRSPFSVLDQHMDDELSVEDHHQVRRSSVKASMMPNLEAKSPLARSIQHTSRTPNNIERDELQIDHVEEQPTKPTISNNLDVFDLPESDDDVDGRSQKARQPGRRNSRISSVPISGPLLLQSFALASDEWAYIDETPDLKIVVAKSPADKKGQYKIVDARDRLLHHIDPQRIDRMDYSDLGAPYVIMIGPGKKGYKLGLKFQDEATAKSFVSSMSKHFLPNQMHAEGR
jgi:hypothetical protein